MKEYIVDMTGYEGLYKVSDKGRVLDNNNNEIELNEVLTAKYNKPYVDLWKNGHCRPMSVALLVALEFCEEGDTDAVEHLDGDEFNNDVDNLQFGSMQKVEEHSNEDIVTSNIVLACKYGPHGYRENDKWNYNTVKSESRRKVEGVVNMFRSFPKYSELPRYQQEKVIIADRDIKIDYNLSYDELKNANIHTLLDAHKEDALWVLDFMRCAMDTIYKETKENTEFRFSNTNLLPKYNINSAKNIKNQVIKTLNLDLNNPIDQQLTKLIDKINEFNKNKEIVPEIVEEARLKEKILSCDSQELKDLFEVVENRNDILDFVLPYDNRNIADEIIDKVYQLIEVRNETPQDMNLSMEDDWIKKIDEYIGIEEKEECEDLFDDEDDPEIIDMFNKSMENDIKEMKEETVKLTSQSKVEKMAVAKFQPITIKNIEEGKEIVFKSRKECKEYLGIGNDQTFSRFLKGNTKLNKVWIVIE